MSRQLGRPCAPCLLQAAHVLFTQGLFVAVTNSWMLHRSSAYLVQGNDVEVIVHHLQSVHFIMHICQVEAPLMLGDDLASIGCAARILCDQSCDPILASAKLLPKLVCCVWILQRAATFVVHLTEVVYWDVLHAKADSSWGRPQQRNAGCSATMMTACRSHPTESQHKQAVSRLKSI